MIYFDNSATTFFKPPAVIAAVTDALKNMSANPGRSGHALAAKAALMIHRTRQSAVDFFDCPDGANVIFTPGCTAALNAAILGSLRRGGNIVITENAHNSVIRPAFELSRAGLVTVTVAANGISGAADLSAIERAVTGDTYMVAVNHISNVTGAKSRVAEIGKFCRRNGILLLLDAAQSAGYWRVSMRETFVDIIAVAPHKGLHAPQGVGILIFGENAPLRPIVFGGTGTGGAGVYQPLDPPEAFESGTLPAPAIAGLAAAIEFSKTNLIKAEKKIPELSGYLLENLKKIEGVEIYTPPDALNGIVSFNLAGYASAEAADLLNERYGICVRAGLHCAPLLHKHLGTLERGAIRASLGTENDAEEIDEFIKAIREIVGAHG
jgi:cysteine desulfurase family protein